MGDRCEEWNACEIFQRLARTDHGDQLPVEGEEEGIARDDLMIAR